jgi:osmotically-inducible protein OsmY
MEVIIIMKSHEFIKKRVVDQLLWDDRVDASDVHVSVKKGGEVTLGGKLPSFSARKAAEEDSWSVLGVTSVKNQINVEYPLSVSIPIDEDIKTKIEGIVSSNININASNIHVSVNHGFVTLDGSVTAYWKKIRVEDIVSDVPGVLDIINKLSVVPTKKMNDQSIAEDITAALSRSSHVNAESVDIKVKNGEVILSGIVSSWMEYFTAFRAAQYAVGVTNVYNKLLIQKT